MIDALLNHKIIIVVVGVLLAIALWYGMSSSSSDVTLTSSPTVAADQELLTTLLTLKAVKLDKTLLGDPAYAALVDISTPIVPEAVGRQNPFAPLQTSVLLSATATPDTAAFGGTSGSAGSSAGQATRRLKR